jgi:NTE family protein
MRKVPRPSRFRLERFVRRLALRPERPVAFALSGGGPFGAMQVGSLRALFEHGVVPDFVCGTSVGALNAALIAFDPTLRGVERLEQTWRDLGERGLFPSRRLNFSWARFLARGDHVFDSEPMRRLIFSVLGEAHLENARIPVAVVATELETGAERIFTSGEVTPRLLASCAMPGIFPPVRVEDRLFIDGGVTNNVPIAPAMALGARTVYVFDTTSPNQPHRPLARPIDYMTHAFALSRAQRAKIERSKVGPRVSFVDVPTPRLDYYVPFTSLEHSVRLMELSYAHTRDWLLGPRAAAEVEGPAALEPAPNPN